MPTQTTDQLAELVDRQHDCLCQLVDLGRQQLQFVTDGNVDALLVLLREKQPWLEAFQRIARELSPYRTHDPESRAWADGQQRQRCQQRLRECDAMYQQVVEQEQQSETMLRRQRDVLAVRLQETHSAHEAHAAYLGGRRQTGIHSGGRLDVSSEG